MGRAKDRGCKQRKNNAKSEVVVVKVAFVIRCGAKDEVRFVQCYNVTMNTAKDEVTMDKNMDRAQSSSWRWQLKLTS